VLGNRIPSVINEIDEEHENDGEGSDSPKPKKTSMVVTFPDSKGLAEIESSN